MVILPRPVDNLIRTISPIVLFEWLFLAIRHECFVIEFGFIDVTYISLLHYLNKQRLSINGNFSLTIKTSQILRFQCFFLYL